MDKVNEQTSLREFLQDLRANVAAGAYGDLPMPNGKTRHRTILNGEKVLEVDIAVDAKCCVAIPGKEAARLRLYLTCWLLPASDQSESKSSDGHLTGISNLTREAREVSA
jgi:hypothetical protein